MDLGTVSVKFQGVGSLQCPTLWEKRTQKSEAKWAVRGKLGFSGQKPSPKTPGLCVRGI